MKLHPEDPRLTAYVLGELESDDAAAVERAVEGDDALLAEIRDIQALQKLLTAQFAFPDEKLLPRQRDAIRKESRKFARVEKVAPFVRFRDAAQPWFIPAAAAAVLTIATFILMRMPDDTAKPVANTQPAAEPQSPPPDPHLPAPGPAHPEATAVAPAASASEMNPEVALPALVHRGSVKTADFPNLDLPVQSGKSSLGWISNSIMTEGKLPSHNAVRLEEILNTFPLRLNGMTAIARDTSSEWHPDSRPDAIAAHVATLSTETIACPWKPSSILLFVSIRGNSQKDSAIKVTYQSNPEMVSRYRLLGFSPVEGKAAETMPSKVAANSATTLVIEIEPLKPGGELGSLVWTADDKPAPTVTISHKSDVEPSDDVRFGAVVCTYAQWLAGDQVGIIDAEIVSALAREIASSALPADRENFLNLIDRSLHL